MFKSVNAVDSRAAEIQLYCSLIVGAFLLITESPLTYDFTVALDTKFLSISHRLAVIGRGSFGNLQISELRKSRGGHGYTVCLELQ